MLRLERVRSKLSDAPSTISIAHPQAFESAFKHTPYSQKTRFLKFSKNSKNYSKNHCFELFCFFSDMTTPVRPMELRKRFHRLTHIWSIRSQWNFSDSIFSYVRIIHCKPWNPFFQCKWVYRYGVVFGVFLILKKRERYILGLFFKFNSKKLFWSCFTI